MRTVGRWLWVASQEWRVWAPQRKARGGAACLRVWRRCCRRRAGDSPGARARREAGVEKEWRSRGAVGGVCVLPACSWVDGLMG
eukprot:567-Rhodomonas_salina.1